MRHVIPLLLLVILLKPDLSLAQDKTPQLKWKVGGGIAWLIADGQLELVRGSRKTVNVDVEGGLGGQLSIGYRINQKFDIDMNLTKGTMKYKDHEVFTTGEVLESSDDLNFTLLSTGINYHLLKNKRLNPYIGLQLSFISYGKQMQITTELPSSSLGSSPSPELVTFDLHNSASLGVQAGVDFQLNNNGWFMGLKTQLNVSNLEASIVDDPEDDGRDIDLTINPLGIIISFGKYF